MATTPVKTLSEASKLTALTGYLSASKNHRMQGIRPKASNAQHIAVQPPSHPARAGQAIEDAMSQAAEKWPEANTWNMDGADAADGIGNWILPRTYAEWNTYDVSAADTDSDDGGDSPAADRDYGQEGSGESAYNDGGFAGDGCN